jgi:hypothetical protein
VELAQAGLVLLLKELDPRVQELLALSIFSWAKRFDDLIQSQNHTVPYFEGGIIEKPWASPSVTTPAAVRAEAGVPSDSGSNCKYERWRA